MTINGVNVQIKPGLCPKCKSKPVATGEGKFIDMVVSKDAKQKFLFFNINSRIEAEVKYCAACGYLNPTVTMS